MYDGQSSAGRGNQDRPPVAPRTRRLASEQCDELDAVRAYYALGHEQARLDEGLGLVEWERTKEIILRYLPDAPAMVADIGGGPGRYALWLAELGYQVQHRDLVPLHVQQLTEVAGARLGITSRVADARQLDLSDGSMDVVLLFGPLYHLQRRGDRLQTLREAHRILRSGGLLFVAAISRWAPRLHGVLVERLYERRPAVLQVVSDFEQTGRWPALSPGSFPCFCHRPRQLRSEIRAGGCQVLDLVAVEGLSFALSDLQERMTDSTARQVVLDAARTIERVPELLGIGPHLLATAQRPPAAAVRASQASTGE